jgi:hypothetical protein
MHNHGKTLASAVVAVSLSTFAVPNLQAKCVSNRGLLDANDSVVYQQYAEDEEHHHDFEERTDQKLDELHGMGAGSSHAIRHAHERHEMTESMHHGLRAKSEAKMNELHDEAAGAREAVKERHEQHERYEESTERN